MADKHFWKDLMTSGFNGSNHAPQGALDKILDLNKRIQQALVTGKWQSRWAALRARSAHSFWTMDGGVELCLKAMPNTLSWLTIWELKPMLYSCWCCKRVGATNFLFAKFSFKPILWLQVCHRCSPTRKVATNAALRTRSSTKNCLSDARNGGHVTRGPC